MKNMQIGTSTVWAPRLTLGAFAIGGGTAWQDTTESEQELVDFIRAAHALGVRSIDTAPVYGTGRGERIVGEAIRDRREQYCLFTKCSLHWRNQEGEFEYDRDGKAVYRSFSKASILADAEDSLRRLNTDYIDVYIIHRCPPLDQFGEAMEAMEILKDRGLIRAAGLSNAGFTDDPALAVETCLKYGRLDLLQESASLLSRKQMRVYLDVCEKHRITLQTYSALEKGALAGKLIENVGSWTGDNRSKYKWFQPDHREKLNELTLGLRAIAERYGCTVPVLCLAWVLAQSDCVNLLVGARRMATLSDSMAALDLNLTAEDLAAMNALSDRANA